MKKVHRLIVTSQAYRMSSGGKDHPNKAIDPDNRYLWRFNPARMEAEVVRDSVLHVAGELDMTSGGQEIDHKQGLTSRRRSLYFAHHGEETMQFLELFDAANPCDCYKRTTSVLPQQALALSNSDLTMRQGRVLARKLWEKVSKGANAAAEQAFVVAVFEQVLTRSPSPAEKQAALAFLAGQVKLFQESGVKPGPGASPGPDQPSSEPAMRARENLVQALLNHNDFVTVR